MTTLHPTTAIDLANRRNRSRLQLLAATIGMIACLLASTATPKGLKPLFLFLAGFAWVGGRVAKQEALRTETRANRFDAIVEDAWVQNVRAYVKPGAVADEPERLLTRPEGTTTGALYADAVQQALEDRGVLCDYKGSTVGPTFVRVLLKPRPGHRPKAISSMAADLQVELGTPAPPTIQPQPGAIAFDIPRTDRQIAHFDKYMATSSSDSTIKVAIGVNVDGRLFEVDLSDPNNCHFLVGGTTGSGKTRWLHSVILSLTSRYSPDAVRVLPIDPKRTEFGVYADSAHLLDLSWGTTNRPKDGIVRDLDQCVEAMNLLVDEMERRYQLFERHRVSDLNQYNDKSPEQLPRIVVVFDEFGDFVIVDKAGDKAISDPIIRLCQKARAAGIHLIMATQRPDKDVCTPLIRANLPAKVALRVDSDANSKIIIDQDGAQNLLGNGDLLFRAAGSPLRLQGLFVDPVQHVAPPVHHGASPANSEVPGNFRQQLEKMWGMDAMENDFPAAENLPESDNDFHARGSSGNPDSPMDSADDGKFSDLSFKLYEAVKFALETHGKTFTIHKILGCQGRNYNYGKAWLEALLRKWQ